jgi:hypothetical protein
MLKVRTAMTVLLSWKSRGKLLLIAQINKLNSKRSKMLKKPKDRKNSKTRSKPEKNAKKTAKRRNENKLSLRQRRKSDKKNSWTN